jgi:hypothetical protein
MTLNIPQKVNFDNLQDEFSKRISHLFLKIFYRALVVASGIAEHRHFQGLSYKLGTIGNYGIMVNIC